MRGQAGFWDIDERYALLSDAGDPLLYYPCLRVGQEIGGDPGRIRTCDTRIRNPVLYPLSYGTTSFS